MRTSIFTMVLISLFLSGFVCEAAIYKWVDQNGTVTFKDTPPPKGIEATKYQPEPLAQIEHEGGSDSQRKESPPVESEPASVKKKSPAKKKKTSAKKKRKDFPPVELYVSKTCVYCDKAKDFLTNNGVPFKSYDIDKNSRIARKHRKISPVGAVPVAVIGGQKVQGFYPDVYKHLLGL